ncbi:hypothetical protein QWY82_11030 [Simiduia curdlanivorans]|uniref:Tetratricopeptide repeat protein n=1 Tax=Simiduia curdlanivorans TaxID=1492769 RepID=A0ABV8VAR5_9GAMM|nr:hypothetical protein [Simiduia curdlanivorans]MDN3639337.1 hypothetical protein [Simiduia curdlanivorans]
MHYRHLFASLCFSIIAALSAGCQNTPKIADTSPDLVKRVLAGEAFIQESQLEHLNNALPDENPFALTEDMKRFAHHYAPKTMSANFRLKQLVWAIMSPNTLGLDYNPTATYTAAESFARREANCLSFTMLLISMAEEVGLKAELNEVSIPPTWDLQDGNRLVYYRHVNALVKLRQHPDAVVDINMEDYNENYEQSTLSKAEAEALYYNNRGVEAMSDQAYTQSFLYFRKAILLSPSTHFIWSNLGVLYNRTDQRDLAEASFKHALSFGKFEPVAASNLARIYETSDRESQAEAIHQALKNFHKRNPYLQFKRALDNQQQGDNEKALAYVNKAIKLFDKDHRFYYLRAQIYASLGMKTEVKQDLQLAEEIALKADQKEMYQTKLERLATLH